MSRFVCARVFVVCCGVCAAIGRSTPLHNPPPTHPLAPSHSTALCSAKYSCGIHSVREHCCAHIAVDSNRSGSPTAYPRRETPRRAPRVDCVCARVCACDVFLCAIRPSQYHRAILVVMTLMRVLFPPHCDSHNLVCDDGVVDTDVATSLRLLDGVDSCDANVRLFAHTLTRIHTLPPPPTTRAIAHAARIICRCRRHYLQQFECNCASVVSCVLCERERERERMRADVCTALGRVCDLSHCAFAVHLLIFGVRMHCLCVFIAESIRFRAEWLLLHCEWRHRVVACDANWR